MITDVSEIRRAKNIVNTHILAVFLMFLFLIPTQGFGFDIQISGNKQKVESFKENNVEYFSFSEYVEFAGGRLDWKIIGHSVTYILGKNSFEINLGSSYFKLNDTVYNMTYPAKLKNGKLFLPPLTFVPFLNKVTAHQITYLPGKSVIRVDSDFFNVTDVAISHKANGMLIEIFLTTDLAYDIFLTEGNWINVSIRDGRINSPRIISRKSRRSMHKLKVHQADGSGQISFQMKKKVDKWHHKLESNPPRIQISIPDINFAMDPPDTQPIIGPDNNIDVIVIDAGHGGTDYGAIGQRGTREKDVCLGIAKKLAKLIRKDKQFKVIMTRDRDETVLLEDRAAIANKVSADLFISIHANASLKKHVRGWNVFFLAQAKNDSARAVAQFENSSFLQSERAFSPGDNFDEDEGNQILSILNEMIMTEFQAESHDFAMMVDKEFRKTLKIPARGVDQAGFYVLNMVFAPSILVETAFISNKTEEKLLKSDRYQNKIAKAIYKAIKRFKFKYESS